MIGIRSLLLSVMLLAGIAAAEGDQHAAALIRPEQPSASAAIGAALAHADALVERYNPDLLASVDGLGKKPQRVMDSLFVGEYATDIGADVRKLTWFSAWVFLLFLILPQAVLLYVIFAFRDRKDGRKPATFTGNHTLEIVWTAIPCVALVIVSFPVWDLAWKMEEAPSDHRHDNMRVEIIASQYKWNYTYLRLGGTNPEPEHYDHKPFKTGSGLPLQPEPLVLVKDRVVRLYMTSSDVNHAWWIPAFGIKQDSIIGRHTYAWFRPVRTGFYKGQCAELCGEGHGVMLTSAVVVEEEQFEREWIPMQRHRSDAAAVLSAMRKQDAAAITQAVSDYLAAGDSPERRWVLQFWVANSCALLSRTGTPTTHILSANDTLTSIAATYGVSVERIRLVNNLEATSDGSIRSAQAKPGSAPLKTLAIPTKLPQDLSQDLLRLRRTIAEQVLARPFSADDHGKAQGKGSHL